MDFTPEKKEEIEKKIVAIIADSLEQKKIGEEDLPEIATYVLENIDEVKNQEELVRFLDRLVDRWDMFHQLVSVEAGEIKEQQENQAIAKVEDLVGLGNIDAALAVAKAATQQS